MWLRHNEQELKRKRDQVFEEILSIKSKKFTTPAVGVPEEQQSSNEASVPQLYEFGGCIMYPERGDDTEGPDDDQDDRDDDDDDDDDTENILNALFDDNPRRRTPKSSSFLVTLNTNKTENSLDEIIDLRTFKSDMEELIVAAFTTDPHHTLIVPKAPASVITQLPTYIQVHLKRQIISVEVQLGCWELTTPRHGSRLHIHFVVSIKYHETFRGYFHIDRQELKNLVRNAFDAIDFKLGPYLNIRHIKSIDLSVADYIKKMQTNDPTKQETLVERTQKRIAEYQNRRPSPFFEPRT